jgi:hypothetical protein
MQSAFPTPSTRLRRPHVIAVLAGLVALTVAVLTLWTGTAQADTVSPAVTEEAQTAPPSVPPATPEPEPAVPAPPPPAADVQAPVDTGAGQASPGTDAPAPAPQPAPSTESSPAEQPATAEPEPAATQPERATPSEPATSATPDEPEATPTSAPAKRDPVAAAGTPLAPSIEPSPSGGPQPTYAHDDGASSAVSPRSPAAGDGRIDRLVAEAQTRLEGMQAALDETTRALTGGAQGPLLVAQRRLQASLRALTPILAALLPALREIDPAQLRGLERLRHELAAAALSAQALLAALDRSGVTGAAVERLRTQLQQLQAYARAAAISLPQPALQSPFAWMAPLAPPLGPLSVADMALAYPAAPPALPTTIVPHEAAAPVAQPTRPARSRDVPGDRPDSSTSPVTGAAASGSASASGSSSTGVPVALIALAALLIPALVRRLDAGPNGWRSAAFARPLERPG